MKIAVASSGLGYIQRGIETWAEDLAHALRKRDGDVTLFQGGGTSLDQDRTVALSSPSRFDPKVANIVQILRRWGGWRYGFGSDYQAEQTLFAARLWRYVRRDFDILHVQDPWVALLLDRLHQAHLSRPRVILGHGTEESTKTLQKYSYLQHLAPCYLDDWKAHQPRRQQSFAIPNFVDTTTFHPADKTWARSKWDFPKESLIILSVAAMKSTHKRADYLIREFSEFSTRYQRPALLVIAGAREAETDGIIGLGKSLLGDKVRFLEGVSRSEMPSLYQSADIFSVASLHEMLPIAFLEALASGLPILSNDTPTLRWVTGDGGIVADLSKEGELARWFEHLENSQYRDSLAEKAREQAENRFSESVVIQQYLEMYATIMNSPIDSERQL